MELLNKKIDVRQIIIAPVYELNHDHRRIDMNNSFNHKNKWVALLPINKKELKSFYNLSNNFNIINTLSKTTKIDEEFVNLEEAKLLTDYLKSSAYFRSKRFISYKDLLYIIVPITQFEKYKNSKSNNIKIIAKKGKYVVNDVTYKDNVYYDRVLKKQEHFAVDAEKNIPVSFEFINDEIPYISKK